MRNPGYNLAIGAAYLSELDIRYRGFRPAVYAAYNAGEYAADAFAERRNDGDPMMFIELIPFSETNAYVKSVMRNEFVYAHLLKSPHITSSPMGLVGSKKSPLITSN